MAATGGSGRPRSSARTPGTAESWASSPGVRSRMQQQRVRDTDPELRVRRLLHVSGLRFRVDHAPLAGLRRRADIVFTKARVAVFIDGCFWHGCPQHGTKASANAGYWSDKLARNQARDADTDQRLVEAGWRVIRRWEHDDPADVAAAVVSAVRHV